MLRATERRWRKGYRRHPAPSRAWRLYAEEFLRLPPELSAKLWGCLLAHRAPGIRAAVFQIRTSPFLRHKPIAQIFLDSFHPRLLVPLIDELVAHGRLSRAEGNVVQEALLSRVDSQGEWMD